MTSMSGPMYEIRREGEINYAKPLARALLRDSRLSFGARGLFSFLWDLPQGWRANSSHLVSQSPQGKTAVRTLLKELESVGAMRDEVIRGEGGKLAGKRWVLVSPDRWAVESPLKKTPDPEAAPEAISTEGLVSRLSEKPTIGETDTKVLLIQGSSSISSTTRANQVVEGIDELVEAAVWSERRGGKIHKEAGFRRAVRTRILSHGPNPEDMHTLRAWHMVQAARVENVATKNQAAVQEKLKIDPAACAEGVKMFSSDTLERMGRHVHAG